MDIQYDKFNKWTEIHHTFYLNDLVPEIVISDQKLTSYINGVIPELSSAEIDQINLAKDNLSGSLDGNDMWLEVTNEIDFNIANITNSDQVKRYLSFIRKRLELTIDLCKDCLLYDWIMQSRTRLEDLHAEMSDEEFEEFQAKGYGSLKIKEYGDKGPIGNYLRTCVHICHSYMSLLDDVIEREGNEQELKDIILDISLSANTHRLILLDKLGLLEPLYTKYHNTLGIVRFTNLVGTILGIPAAEYSGLKKSLSDFITETYLKPSAKKTVQTNTADRKVSAYLTGLGLTNY